MIETMKITIVDDCVVEANPKNEKKKQQQELPSYIKDNRKTKEQKYFTKRQTV